MCRALLTCLPGGLQICGEALQVDHGRLLKLRIQPSAIDALSQIVLGRPDCGEQHHGIL